MPISFDVKEIVSSVFDSIADAQEEAEEALEKLTTERNAIVALRDQMRRLDTMSRAEKLPTLDELFYNKLSQITISIVIKHELSSLSEKLVEEARSAVKACPNELTSDVKPVQVAIDLLGKLDEFTRTIWAALDIPQPSLFESQLEKSEFLRVRVPQPEHLIGISKVLLVDGQPGLERQPY